MGSLADADLKHWIDLRMPHWEDFAAPLDYLLQCGCVAMIGAGPIWPTKV